MCHSDSETSAADIFYFGEEEGGEEGQKAQEKENWRQNKGPSRKEPSLLKLLISSQRFGQRLSCKHSLEDPGIIHICPFLAQRLSLKAAP